MKEKREKPSPEAKALSLFLMAFKSTSPAYKEKSKQIKGLWDLVKIDRLTQSEYLNEVEETLTSYGGYSEVIEKTVRFYIEKTGKWTLKGDDKYCKDAQEIADQILKT